MKKDKWYLHQPLRNALISGLITGSGFTLAHLNFIPRNIEITLYIFAIVIGGYHWIREGIEKFIFKKVISIEILMLSAAVGSSILGMWDEAAFLAFLYGAAEGLEEYTYAKTRSSIRKLLDLAPKIANVIKDGKEIPVPAAELKIGDIFIVRPGESIPTDGIIIKGNSTVDESPVTGESIPVEKKEGMRVFAGTINRNGMLEVKATTTFENNTLSKLIHLVEEAQERKGKAQLFIEKFGKIYSPMVLAVALMMIVIAAALGKDISTWAIRAVTLIVAAAPCALVMSTPVAIAAGIGRAGSRGVLIKGGVYLENLGKVKIVAFDKTGTLTIGKPVVTDVVPFDGNDLEILRLAYSVEKFSEHPLAKAIVEKAKKHNINPYDVTEFEALTGAGAKAKIKNGKTIYIGKTELFETMGVKCPNNKYIEKLRNEGKTIILVGTNEKINGIIAIRDEIRPLATETISKLHEMNIKTIMLTGDNEITAKAIAKKLNIENIKANLKPIDKINIIKELENQYGTVAMVGDGINDAPALAQASVGIAMGTAGTDAAIEAADVALMSDDLTKVVYAIRLGKRARKISTQNIVFSIAVLLFLIPLSLAGMISVALAVFFHEVSELLAVANGLRVSRDAILQESFSLPE